MPERVSPTESTLAQRRTLHQIDTAVEKLLGDQQGNYRGGMFRLEGNDVSRQHILRIAQAVRHIGSKIKDLPTGKTTEIELHDGIKETAGRHNKVSFIGIRLNQRFLKRIDALFEKGYYLKGEKYLEESHQLTETEARDLLVHFSHTNASLRIDTSGRTRHERLRDRNVDKGIRVDVNRLLQLAKEGNGLNEGEVSDVAKYKKDTTSVIIIKNKISGTYDILIRDERNYYLDPTDSDFIIMPTSFFLMQPSISRHKRIMCYQLYDKKDRDERITQDRRGLANPINGALYEDRIQIALQHAS